MHEHTPQSREIIMHLTLTGNNKKSSSGFPTEHTFQSISSKGSSPLRFKYSLSPSPIQFSEIRVSGAEKSRDAITSTTYYYYKGIFHFAEEKGSSMNCHGKKARWATSVILVWISSLMKAVSKPCISVLPEYFKSECFGGDHGHLLVKFMSFCPCLSGNVSPRGGLLEGHHMEISPTFLLHNTCYSGRM